MGGKLGDCVTVIVPHSYYLPKRFDMKYTTKPERSKPSSTVKAKEAMRSNGYGKDTSVAAQGGQES